MATPIAEKRRLSEFLASLTAKNETRIESMESTGAPSSSGTSQAPSEPPELAGIMTSGLLDSVSEIIMILDARLAIQYANAPAGTLLGKTPADLAGTGLTDFILTEDHPLARRATEAALSGERWTGELRLLRSDGTSTRLRVAMQPFRGGGPVTAIGVVISEPADGEDLGTLSAALDQSPASVIVTNADGEIEFVNKQFMETSGYSAEEVKGKNPRFLKSGLTPALVYEQMWATLESGNDWRGELLNRMKNGELVLEEVHVFPVRDAVGRTTHYVSTHQNVTSRRLAEEQLRESDQRYRFLLNTVGDALFMIDQETGRILDCNIAAEKLYSYTREEILSLRMVALSSEPYATSLDTANPSPRVHLRYHCRRDGTVFPVEISNGVYTVGGRTVIISSVRDVTRRVQNEELLQQTMRRNSVILETAIDGFYILDEQGSVTDANAALCRMLRYSIDEIKNLTIGDIDALSSREEIMEALGELNGEPVFFETKQRRKDGVVIEVEVRAQRVEIEGKRLVFCSVRNITQRKRAREALEASLREKEVLLKEVHHRVKNNLQIISSLLSLQSRQVRDPADLALFTESQNRVRTMALIHERLYRSGNLTRIGMKEYIESLTSGLLQSHGSAAPGAVVEVKVVPENLTFDISMCVPTGLIVTELVTNSLKYAFRGNGEGKVTVSLEQEGPETYRLVVSDNGAGLPAGVDFHNTSTLGMQLVQSLAEQLNGSVTLDSSRGTAFIIVFRTTPAPSA